MNRLEILSISKYNYPSSWEGSLRTHRHGFFQLFISLEGTGEITAAGRKLRFSDGQYVLILPNQSHTVISVHSRHLQILDVKFSASGDFEQECLQLPPWGQMESELLSRLEQAHFNWRAYKKRGKEIAHLLVRSALLDMQEEETTDDVLPPVRVRGAGGIFKKVSDYIGVSYVQGFTLDQIAGDLGYSKTYLCTAFREQAGQSIMDYLKYVRVRHAVELLCGTDLSLSEISELVGFKNVSHFGSVFKKKTEMSPGQMRQREAGRNRQELKDQKEFLVFNKDKYVQEESQAGN